MGASSSKERLAAGKELQLVLVDQVEADAAFTRFLEILYPGDSEKHQAMREGTSDAAHRDCEMSTREAFEQHGKFDAFSGFAFQFQRIIVEACADQAESGSNVDLVAAAKQACTSTTVV